MEYKYRFTLFVPCYNSSKFIHRVFDSIDNFTFRDFELIIVNDCSTDNTSEIIKEYLSKVDFPVKFLDREKNAGLNENYKYALENAEGEFFISMGHDDEWMPETLETFDALLKKYDNDKIAGIGCLCKTQYGDLVGYEFSKDVVITNCFEMYFEKNKRRHEIPLNYKTSIYKEYVAKNPKCSAWDLLIGCDYDVIFVNKVLRIYYINENPLRLTARKRIDMAEESYLNSLYFINKFQYKFKGRRKEKISHFLRGIYSGCLAGKGITTIFHDVIKTRDRIGVVIVYIPLWILSKIFS